MAHPLNWYAGWSLLMAAVLTGALLGLGFHRDDFLGGYDSWRRRLFRLGHIALAAIGMLNILLGLSPIPKNSLASYSLFATGILMPGICFLSAWRKPFRSLFFLPVACFSLAILLILLG